MQKIEEGDIVYPIGEPELEGEAVRVYTENGMEYVEIDIDGDYADYLTQYVILVRKGN